VVKRTEWQMDRGRIETYYPKVAWQFDGLRGTRWEHFDPKRYRDVLRLVLLQVGDLTAKHRTGMLHEAPRELVALDALIGIICDGMDEEAADAILLRRKPPHSA
jgi:hypothetical protein